MTRIRTRMFIYILSLSSTIPSSRVSHSDPLPLPGNVFSCVTRDAWRIFHPDQGRVITAAPGNGFWSKDRKWAAKQMINVTRVTRASSGWKIPQAHDARVTDKTFRSCWRVNNGFWRFLGGVRVARTSIMRHLMGQEGARKALGGHREGRVLVYPPRCIG